VPGQFPRQIRPLNRRFIKCACLAKPEDIEHYRAGLIKAGLPE
jgi:hypothetical protein